MSEPSIMSVKENEQNMLDILVTKTLDDDGDAPVQRLEGTCEWILSHLAY